MTTTREQTCGFLNERRIIPGALPGNAARPAANSILRARAELKVFDVYRPVR